MRIEQVEKLLVEVGELLDLAQIAAAEEEPSWQLTTRDGEIVHVDSSRRQAGSICRSGSARRGRRIRGCC